MFKRKKGQSTLEYVLVLSAIIAAIIFATFMFIRPRLQNGLNSVTNTMASALNKIKLP